MSFVEAYKWYNDKMATRISSNDVTKLVKPKIWAGYEEDLHMTQDAATRIYRDIYSVTGFYDGSGDGLGQDDSKFNERPELSDIAGITQAVYYDAKQKKKFVKVTISIRNSSGKTLLGIDARKTIPVQAGGTVW